MRRPYLLLACLVFAQPAACAPKWVKQVVKVAEHLALGAGTEVAVSQAAGGSQKWGAGLLATGLVAGFKEGSDAVAGRDTKKQAATHALEILAGAGVAIAVKHR